MDIKSLIRSVLIFLRLDLTKNLENDRLTRLIMKRIIRRDFNCVDVGCHRGEILSLMLKYAPQGNHHAFEPIPGLFSELEAKFGSRARIYPFALSDQSGETRFQLVRNAPAYSGINRRPYPEIEEIQVNMRTLDELIPREQKIHFIKIDVEGAEFGVLKGALNLLKRDRPAVVFESGLGASDYYGTDPRALYHFLTEEAGLKIFTLKSFVRRKGAMTEQQFLTCYETNSDYYFIASHT